VHLAVDVQLVAQARHVIDQVPGRIVGHASVASSSLALGVLLRQPALVEKHDAYAAD